MKRRSHELSPPKQTTMRDLFETLGARKRPEDVAQMILEVAGETMTRGQRRLLERAASGSLKRKLIGYTSMLEDFAKPIGLEKQIRLAEVLFVSAYRMSAAECAQPDKVEAFIQALSSEIRKSFGHSDFMHDRLNRAARRARGLDLSKRRYNKMFRHLGRMERKLRTLIRELKKLELTKVGKSSLASKLAWKNFSSDQATACFIAYYTARCNLRSEFTIAGQERPYDQISHMLLTRARAGRPNWWAIAHVLPDKHILDQLSPDEKGRLLGTWYQLMCDIAELLEEIWMTSDIRRDTMIVRRGNDSTTWNNTANAWNKARAAWIALLYAMDMESVLDAVCPGKVLRLMAADVAAWHRAVGGGLDPDTAVWNELPLPWQALAGEVPCGRQVVSYVCRRHGVDPMKRGWIMPPPKRKPVRYRPTPELVHGVTVTSPQLAKVLRKAGWFSGKSAKVDPAVTDNLTLH